MCGITAIVGLSRDKVTHATNGTNGINGTKGFNGINGFNGADGNVNLNGEVTCGPCLHHELRSQLDQSLETIAHRGPDASGAWIRRDGAIGQSHTRAPTKAAASPSIEWPKYRMVP